MKNHRISPKAEMESLCAEVRPDDGIPPHVLKKHHARRQQSSERTSCRALQYHKVVRRCLDAAFASVCADPLLTDLTVRSVEPLGRGAKLLVVVETPPDRSIDQRTIESALRNAAGLLRSVIAGEVHRKRTPSLCFRVLPTSVENPESE